MEILGALNGLREYGKTEKVEPASKRAKESKGKSPAGSKGDSVKLSNAGKLYSSAMKTAQETPEVRQQKIDEIKALVQSGQYKPNIQKTAAKIVEEDLDLLM